MKKLFFLLAAAGMIFTACESEPEQAYIKLSETAVSISPDGGSVDVTVSSNYAWSVTTENDWCTASAQSGQANPAGQKITLSAEQTYDSREATFVFKCGDAEETLTVSQEFKKAVVADGDQLFELTVYGEEIELKYKATVECEVAIPEEAQNWITVAEATKALEAGSVKLTVADNVSTTPREAVVKVVSTEDEDVYAEYTVKQQAVSIMEYTSTDGNKIEPNEEDFGVRLLTNNYEDGKGIMKLAGPVTKIGDEAFKDCTTLATITIPETVTEIGVQAFHGCTGLTAFSGKFASEDGKSLIVDKTLAAYIIPETFVKYTTPAGIEAIAPKLFYGCTTLAELEIRADITAIGAGAFENCSALVSVDCESTTPATLGAAAFNGCAEGLKINVPINGLEAYQAADVWKEYTILPYFGVVIE